MPSHSTRRFFQNPFYQVFRLNPEQLTGQEQTLDGHKLDPTYAASLGSWYFGPSPRTKTPGDYPVTRFGPYRSYPKALEAAKKHFGK